MSKNEIKGLCVQAECIGRLALAPAGAFLMFKNNQSFKNKHLKR